MSVEGRLHSFPDEVLQQIFSQVVSSTSFCYNRGSSRSWVSHELAWPLPLVCRAWTQAGNAVLYRSVPLANLEGSQQLLRTFQSRPELASLVNKLLLDASDVDRTLSSLAVTRLEAYLDVAELCQRVAHLSANVQYPVHSRLRQYINSIPIESLVLGLHFHVPESFCVEERSDADCVVWRLPHLLRLDVDSRSCNASSSSKHGLRNILEITDVVNAARSTLQVLSVYIEDQPPPPSLPRAIGQVVGLKHLQFIYNPPLTGSARTCPPRHTDSLLDDALRQLESLETLRITATDITNSFIQAIPDRVKKLCLVALNDWGNHRCEALVRDLHDERNAPGLRKFVIVDAPESWKDEQAASLDEVCRKRGVSLSLKTDEVAVRLNDGGA